MHDTGDRTMHRNRNTDGGGDALPPRFGRAGCIRSPIQRVGVMHYT